MPPKKDKAKSVPQPDTTQVQQDEPFAEPRAWSVGWDHEGLQGNDKPKRKKQVEVKWVAP